MQSLLCLKLVYNDAFRLSDRQLDTACVPNSLTRYRMILVALEDSFCKCYSRYLAFFHV